MRVTLSDVAKRAGVGLSTASRALNQSGYVSESVKQRVFAAVAELDYYPDMLAQQLATDQRRTLTLFEVGNTGNVQSPQDIEGFFGPLSQALGQVIAAAGYELNIGFQRLDEHHPAEVLARIRRSRSSAAIVLFIRTELDERMRSELASIDVPAVSINCPLQSLGIPTILVDIRGAAFAATKHLIDNGFSRIAHIQGPADLPATEERIAGYTRAMEAANLPCRMVPGGFGPDLGYEAMQEMLTNSEPPDAVFCANDLAAIGALRAIQERGLKVPQDVGLVGFDDILVSRYVVPSLTTIRQPQERTGTEAGRAILDALAGKTPPETISIPCELVIRESSVFTAQESH